MKEYGEWIKDKFRDEDLVREYLIEAEELSRQNNDPPYHPTKSKPQTPGPTIQSKPSHQ